MVRLMEASARMRMCLALIGVAVVATPATAGAQQLASRVANAPDGWVRFEYEARPGVCGHGDGIWIQHGDRYVRRGGDCNCTCQEGPIRIEMRVEDGEPRDVDADVGGSWRDRSGTVTELGAVEPAAAAEYLLELARTSSTDAAEDAVFPATIARGYESWPGLLRVAREGQRRDARRQAVFWLGQDAGERATEGLISIIEDDDELEVREHAVFALSQQKNEESLDALMQIAASHREPELRKKAMFWLGQRDDPRVIDFFERILLASP